MYNAPRGTTDILPERPLLLAHCRRESSGCLSALRLRTHRNAGVEDSTVLSTCGVGEGTGYRGKGNVHFR